MQKKRVGDISTKIDQLFPFDETEINIDLDKVLEEKQNQIKKELYEKLDDFINLYDEGIKLVLQIHRVCEMKHNKTMQSFSLVLLSAKMVTLLLGMRKLIFAGMTDAIKTLNRSLIETIDLFFACIQDDELSNKYANKTEMYDNNDFYWKNISKKVGKKSVKLIQTLGATNDRVEYFINRRENQKEFLSNAIHASYNASFSNYISYKLDFTMQIGELFGKITTAYPKMMLEIMEDINILNQVFELSIEKEIFLLDGVEDTKDYLIYLHFQKKYEYLFAEFSEEMSELGRLYTNAFHEASEHAKKQEGESLD